MNYMQSSFTPRFTYFFILTLILLFVCNITIAQTLSGKITDKTNDEPLIGATILVKETGQSTSVQLDGYFKIKNIKPATYNLVITFIGYERFFQAVSVRADEKNIIYVKMKPIISELGNVNITATNNSSEAKARNLEKNADQLVNAVSSKAIELSPDITVGNVLQRVSGVSTERSGSGDGRYAIIRGLDKRYTYTSINGILLPSPDPTQRSVPLDIFPAELVQRVEVYKSLTPDMDADAIAGATNMVMKDAPDHLILNANLGTGLSTVFSGRSFSGFSRNGVNFLSPTEIHGNQYIAVPSDIAKSQLNFHDSKNPLNLQSSFTLGDQFLHHNVGFTLGGSYFREHRGNNSLYYPITGINYNPSNQPTFTAGQNIQDSYLQSRLGLNGTLTYALSPNHHFDLYGLFLQLDNDQHRSTTQNNIGSSAMGTVNFEDRVVIDRKNLSLISLSGRDKILNTLDADWTVYVSKAGSKTPDQITFQTAINNPTPALTFNLLPSTWTHSEDQDKAVNLNFKYTPISNITISAGGLYRNKNRNGFYNYYQESAKQGQTYTGIDNAVFLFIPAVQAGMGITTSENIYTAHETISAAYIEAKMLFYKKLQVITGVRQEVTDQGYESMLSAALPGKSATFKYTDLLPGLHLRYLLSDKANLRLSYFAGLTRPTLFELIPSSTGVISDVTGQPVSGNYNLKHATGDNIDFRYDNFFSTTTYFLAGVFYKKITDPIEFAGFNKDGSPVRPGSNPDSYGPTNPASSATNYGLELVASKFIGKFGLSGNYSYIRSTVTTVKTLLTPNSVGSQQLTTVLQTRPLQGQSDHIGNLSFLFKDDKSGFDAQLSFVYTGKRILVVSPYYQLDIWQRASSQVDFSLNKEVGRHLSFYFKMTNLLNNNLYQDLLRVNNLSAQQQLPGQTDANRILIRRDEFKQTLLTGLRYKF